MNKPKSKDKCVFAKFHNISDKRDCQLMRAGVGSNSECNDKGYCPLWKG